MVLSNASTNNSKWFQVMLALIILNGLGVSSWCNGLFNAKAILWEELQRFYLTHSGEDMGVHTFHKGIYPKVNVIARLEYELA